MAPSGRGQPLNIMRGLELKSPVLPADSKGSVAVDGVRGTEAADDDAAAARRRSLPPSFPLPPSEPRVVIEVPELIRDSGWEGPCAGVGLQSVITRIKAIIETCEHWPIFNIASF